MKEITLTINGKTVKGREGDTVLEVCKAGDIHVPTLCHLKGITDVGACRMCVVEIEKERRPVPACTYPARDGLVVQTHNEKLEKYRRQILELMFTERNHLCAQCVASGDCELQDLAYEYQMDNVRYPYSWPALPLDSVNEHLVIDHNRCILCGRCVRICDEVVGVHTLDFGYRGWKDTVVADLNQPLGESSCISCGACFQVCPTGTIFSKDGAYQGRPEEYRTVSSICPVCGIGCKIEALVKDNRIVRIDSPDLTARRGILCHKGRFSPLYQNGERVRTALVRNRRGVLEPRPLSEALELVAGKLAEIKARYGASSIAGIASSQASSEALMAFKELMAATIKSEVIDTFDGDTCRTIARGEKDSKARPAGMKEPLLEEILKADAIVLVGGDPSVSHPVAGSYIARAARQNGAALIVIDPVRNAFQYHANLRLSPRQGTEAMALDLLSKAVIEKTSRSRPDGTERIATLLKDIDVARDSKQTGVSADDLLEAARVLTKARRTIFVYGEGIMRNNDPAPIASLLNLAAVAARPGKGGPRLIALTPGGNSRGARDMGLVSSSQSVAKSLKNGDVKALYVLSSDDAIDPAHLSAMSRGVEFMVIQSSYLPPAKTRADVVLPSPRWTEARGKYTTLDGVTRSTARIVKPPTGMKTDAQILAELSGRLKK